MPFPTIDFFIFNIENARWIRKEFGVRTERSCGSSLGVDSGLLFSVDSKIASEVVRVSWVSTWPCSAMGRACFTDLIRRSTAPFICDALFRHRIANFTMIKVIHSTSNLLCSPNEISSAVTKKSSWIPSSTAKTKEAIQERICLLVLWWWCLWWCLYFANCNKYCQHIGHAHK